MKNCRGLIIPPKKLFTLYTITYNSNIPLTNLELSQFHIVKLNLVILNV